MSAPETQGYYDDMPPIMAVEIAAPGSRDGRTIVQLYKDADRLVVDLVSDGIEDPRTGPGNMVSMEFSDPDAIRGLGEALIAAADKAKADGMFDALRVNQSNAAPVQ